MTGILDRSEKVSYLKEVKELGRYLYAVIPYSEKISYGEIGMDDREVYTLPYRNIATVVSNNHIKDFELTENNVMRHDATLKKIMEDHTVLPAEFGTIFHNERNLNRVMRISYNTVTKCLKLFNGMVELGVKAVKSRDADISEYGNVYPDEIIESLKTVAEQSVSGGLFSDRLLFNESFLVKKDNIALFSEKVTELTEKYPNTRFLYSGPWAPYGFVYLKVGKEGLELARRG